MLDNKHDEAFVLIEEDSVEDEAGKKLCARDNCRRAFTINASPESIAVITVVNETMSSHKTLGRADLNVDVTRNTMIG